MRVCVWGVGVGENADKEAGSALLGLTHSCCLPPCLQPLHGDCTTVASQADAAAAGDAVSGPPDTSSSSGDASARAEATPPSGIFVGIAIGGLAVVAVAAAVVAVVRRRRRSPKHSLALPRSPLSEDSEAPPPSLVVASDDGEQPFYGHSAA